ncbi:unnamed protein product [Ilex paraguariensis]|uniref:Uncharacterized protein n=1 Tax=Ilex paraguariensis TaxID=185542 RepID=A0ABC8UEI8_9AQUA
MVSLFLQSHSGVVQFPHEYWRCIIHLLFANHFFCMKYSIAGACTLIPGARFLQGVLRDLSKVSTVGTQDPTAKAIEQSDGEANDSDAITAANDVITSSNGDNSALTADSALQFGGEKAFAFFMQCLFLCERIVIEVFTTTKFRKVGGGGGGVTICNIKMAKTCVSTSQVCIEKKLCLCRSYANTTGTLPMYLANQGPNHGFKPAN